MDDILASIRRRFGDGWGRDPETNLRFSVEAEHLLNDIAGAHFVGSPEIEDGLVTLRIWIDHPLHDLMSADRLAYEVFGRVSEEIFYTERRFVADGIRYSFITGSARHGHIGALLFFGPHAADFAERFRRRMSGGLRYHA